MIARKCMLITHKTKNILIDLKYKKCLGSFLTCFLVGTTTSIMVHKYFHSGHAWLRQTADGFKMGLVPPYLFGYVWFPENLRENTRERKYKGKVEGKKK